MGAQSVTGTQYKTVTSSTQGGLFTKGTTTKTTTSNDVVKYVFLKRAKSGLVASKVICLLLMLFARSLKKIRQKNIERATETLETVRRALGFWREQWVGLHISYVNLIEYFSAPEPLTLKMMASECGPKLLAARESTEDLCKALHF